jgi:hypothetical protein
MPHGGRQIAIRDEHGSLREEIEQGYCDFLVMGGCSRPCGWNSFSGGHSINFAVVKNANTCLTLGSGLIDQSQKMTVAAMQMADMKVCAQRS